MAARPLLAVALFALLLLAGCSSPGGRDTGPDDAALPQQGTAGAPHASDPGQPGLYRLSAAGLETIDSLPGLTWTTEGARTTYVLDATEAVKDNTEVQVLAQALADQEVEIAMDIDMPFDPALVGTDPNQGNDVVCIGTQIRYDEGEHGFYFDRAAGHAGIPPTSIDSGYGWRGDGVGHGMAGPVDFLQLLYGSHFKDAEQRTFDVPAGAYLRAGNGLSQYPALATQGDDRHWTQTITFNGPHRLVAIPDAPLYCASGFGEFEDAQQLGVTPTELTIGGRRSIQTLYGSQAALNLYTPWGAAEADPNPTNSATVDFLGTRCVAGPGRHVTQSSFAAGTVTIEVQQWTGHPVVILAGHAIGQGVLSAWGEPACSA